ncbi:serine/threonine protein kinase [Embleya scabrispora]|uniref:non-specific serine/threonine protein kinase n=1 Tax=Embleya scabrispora TaxID=159449 RepID=A0A1T3NMX5_9ACTN|nr:serine/threonine-protein kinase [Embleya scabrispora]OPC78011.1 serine/threonine protein kinase [Embleya scabrispora]
MVARVLDERYELVRFVGRGGMGEVWEGRDRRIGRRVAVKLLPHGGGDASATTLFLREVRTAGALDHPGVVTVFDVGHDAADDALFMVMEFVQGRDPAAVLREDGVPPVAVAVDWTGQATAALGRAHAAGIVHRDLKPANLMRTDEGRIKVLDFGIARFMETTNHSGKVMGTLAYMSPERFDEHPGDARSDLYSLGCVLYELLTGNVPFEATGPVGMMNAHLLKPPARPGEQRPGIPAALDRLVLDLLAKNPAERPASAEEVGERLRAAIAPAQMPPVPPAPGPWHAHGGGGAVPPGPGPAARPAIGDGAAGEPTRAVPVADPGRPAVGRGMPDGGGVASPAPAVGRRRFLWPAAGAAVTAGGITTAVLLDDRDDPSKPAASTPAGGGTPGSARTWRFTTGGWVHSSPAVADGVVYVGSLDNRLYALEVATGAKKWAFPTGGGITSSPAVARGLVYVGSTDENLYALDVATGLVKWRFPTEGKVASSPAVADGIVYIGSEDQHVYALNADTGTMKWSYPMGHVYTWPAVADGVVYVGSNDQNLYAIDAAGGVKKWAFPAAGAVNAPPRVAGGVVYVGSEDKNVYAIDAATGAKKWSYRTGGKVDSSPAVAGGVVYVGSDDKNLYAVDAATGAKKWSYPTGDKIDSSPEVVGGVIYFGSRDKNVYALDAATSNRKWTYSTGGEVRSSAAVVGGVAYIGSGDGNVYAIDTTTGAGPT